MKRMLLVLSLFCALALMAAPVAAGPDLHVKWMYYDGSSVFAPGAGIYWLGSTPWGFMVEHSFVGLEFESAEKGCDTCAIGEVRSVMNGFWDAQVLYDISLGGCNPGPCDKGKLRLGVGLGVPAYLGASSVHGVQFGAPEAGITAGIGYIFDMFDGKLKDCAVRWELYYNWNRNDLGSGISVHVDMFSLGDWIRGHGPIEPEPEPLATRVIDL